MTFSENPADNSGQPARQPLLTLQWQTAALVQCLVCCLCLADVALVLWMRTAATLTWDTAVYMLSYDQGRFNELMTVAVPLFAKLFQGLDPGVVAFRTVRYVISALLACAMFLALWRFALGQGGTRPLNVPEGLAWFLTLLLSCFLGNAMLIQFWPLGHHDLTSWLYILAVALFAWSLAKGQTAVVATSVLLGVLSAVQLFVKIPCAGGFLVFFALYWLFFVPGGRRLASAGCFGLGFVACAGLLLATLCPVSDIMASIAPSRVRFDSAFGTDKTTPVQIILKQILDVFLFVLDFFRYYWALLCGAALLTACAGRWSDRLPQGVATTARRLLPVVMATPLLATLLGFLRAFPEDPSLIASLGQPPFLLRYGFSGDYGLPLAEFTLFFLVTCLLEWAIGGRPRRVPSGPILFLAAILLGTPFFMSAGSSQPIMQYSQEGGWSFIAFFVLFLLLFPASRIRGRTFILATLCLFLIVQQYKYVSLMFSYTCVNQDLAARNLFVSLPMCAKPPILDFTVAAPGLRNGKGLRFTPEQAAFYSGLDTMLRQAGFRPGDNILALYGLGSAVHLLGGRSPGTLFYYPEGIFGPDFNARMLALASPDALRSSFVLVNDPLMPNIVEVLEQAGLRLDNDFTLVGTLRQPLCPDMTCRKPKNDDFFTVSVYAPKAPSQAQ